MPSTNKAATRSTTDAGSTNQLLHARTTSRLDAERLTHITSLFSLTRHRHFYLTRAAPQPPFTSSLQITLGVAIRGREATGGSGAAPLQAACAPADKESMQRLLAIAAAVAAALTLAGPAAAAGSSSVAALQVALRAHGHYPAAVDGVDGPLTRAGLTTFQRRTGLPASGRVGRATRSALGPLGRPLLGQRELGVGAVGWDVSSLEFKLVRYGLSPAAVDGRFTSETAKALARLQLRRGLRADGIAGKQTSEPSATVDAAVVRRARPKHVVVAGESFFSIAERYGVSPLLLARASGLRLSAVIVPGQRLTLPRVLRDRRAARMASTTLPRRLPTYERRSTTGRPCTASMRDSHVRLRGWNPGSRRMSSRTSAPSA